MGSVVTGRTCDEVPTLKLATRLEMSSVSSSRRAV